MIYKYKPLTNDVIKASELNSKYKDISTDLFDLYVTSLENKANMDAEIACNNDTTSSIINKLNELEQVINTTSTTTVLTAYDDIMYPTSIPDTAKAFQYKEYGQVTLPILESTTYYMTYNEDTGEYNLIDDADKYISSVCNNNKINPRVAAIYKNDILRAFNSNISEAFYTRAVTDNTQIDSITETILCKLPGNVIVNTIKLIPLPEFNINIESIRYTSANGSNKVITDTFNDTYLFPVEHATRQVFNMPDTSIRELSITLEQPEYTTYNNNKTFKYGARIISLQNNIYSNMGYIIYPIVAKTDILNNIKLDWLADTNSSAYLYSDLNAANTIDDSFILRNNGNTLTPVTPLAVTQNNTYYLLIKLGRIETINTTPVFKGATITWG